MSSRLLFRMTAPLAAISLLLLAVGVGAAWYVHRLQRSVSELLANHVAGVRAAEKLESGLREVRAALTHYLLSQEVQYLQALPALRQDAEAWLREAERLAGSPREQELIRDVQASYQKLARALDRLTGVEPGRNDRARVITELDDLITKEILPPAHAYLLYNEDMADRESIENRLLARRVVLVLVLLGTCGGMAGLLAGYAIARGFRQSIVQLDVPVRDAAGKLSQVLGPITVSTGKGLDDLEGGMRRIAHEIGTVIERLQRSQDEMLRREKLAAVGQLAAGMAHELRNPLAAMKILVQSSREQPNAGGLTQRDLEILEEEIVRMEIALRSFLDFARPPRLEKRPLDIGKIIEQTLTLMSPRAQQQGVRLESALPGSSVLIDADVGQVRQVLLNLLINALEALPGGGTVRIEAALEDGWLALRVSDTGTGLPAQVGERIFEPFFSTKETGIGLGLPISRQILEAHGGTIVADNRLEGGARFTCRLPVAG